MTPHTVEAAARVSCMSLPRANISKDLRRRARERRTLSRVSESVTEQQQEEEEAAGNAQHAVARSTQRAAFSSTQHEAAAALLLAEPCHLMYTVATAEWVWSARVSRFR